MLLLEKTEKLRAAMSVRRRVVFEIELAKEFYNSRFALPIRLWLAATQTALLEYLERVNGKGTQLDLFSL